MSLDDPVIITCSISGSLANRDQCPAIPYTPEEYAAEARRIVDEGGVMIHIHARRADGTPSYEIEDACAELEKRHDAGKARASVAAPLFADDAHRQAEIILDDQQFGLDRAVHAALSIAT